MYRTNSSIPFLECRLFLKLFGWPCDGEPKLIFWISILCVVTVSLYALMVKNMHVNNATLSVSVRPARTGTRSGGSDYETGLSFWAGRKLSIPRFYSVVYLRLLSSVRCFREAVNVSVLLPRLSFWSGTLRRVVQSGTRWKGTLGSRFFHWGVDTSVLWFAIKGRKTRGRRSDRR